MVKGKIALVTGGGSGIGRATCQILAREGAKVIAADLNEAGAEETVKSLSGDGHLSIFMDVTDSESVEAGIVAIKNQYQGPPTVLVNSAGIGLMSCLLDITDELYDKSMATNVKGTINTTKAVCRELVEAKLTGSIVNIGSVYAKGGKNWSIYAATKGAVESFSKSVSKELGRDGIRCNIVCPGPIDTPMVQSRDKSIIDQVVNALSMRRIGKPEEVAEVVTFLASKKSSYVTGSCIYVDGGF